MERKREVQRYFPDKELFDFAWKEFKTYAACQGAIEEDANPFGWIDSIIAREVNDETSRFYITGKGR